MIHWIAGNTISRVDSRADVTGSAWAATLYLGARFRSHSVFVLLYKKHPLTVSVIQVIVKRSTRNNHLPDDVSNLSQTAPLAKYSK